ncbi:MAG: hypothetical protein GTN73_09510 [Candidatus Aminicenantes bacterium]|nr:hypothetical protein [Candidatus Aminicenantes bacterium]
MKKYLVVFVLVISLVFFWNCISFKAGNLLPSENQVESIHLCKKIDDSSDLLKPLDIQSEFTLKDDRVICFIKLKDISTKIDLKWKWYSPDKKLVRDTGNIIVSKGDRYLAAATAYDMYKLNPENIAEGQWTVVIFMNDKFIGKKLFQILPSSR